MSLAAGEKPQKKINFPLDLSINKAYNTNMLSIITIKSVNKLTEKAVMSLCIYLARRIKPLRVIFLSTGGGV